MQTDSQNSYELKKMPEIKLSVYFLILVSIMAILSSIFLPIFWMFINIILFVSILALVIIGMLRISRQNLEVKIEQKEFENIITNLFDAIIAYDQNFKIMIFNKSAEKLFGLSASEVVGKIFTPENVKNQKYALLCQILFPSLAPLVVKRSDSGEFPQLADISFQNPKLILSAITDRITDPSGNVLGFVKVLHNRTREEDILKSKSEFIEVAAHQLRTPLTAINWILESLSKEQLPDAQKELVTMGSSAVANVLKTVNDLLDVSQMEEGKYGYQFEDAEIIAFVEQIMTENLPYAQENGIKMYLKKPDAPVNVYIDKQKLSIALANLLSNAIKYNTQNGEVVVEIKKIDNQPFLQISVHDTGIGIPQENINHIFTKFFRADNAQKTQADGTGLGLYIVKNIIKRHGGTIGVDSQVNRGTTFYFTLPLNKTLIPPVETSTFGD